MFLETNIQKTAAITAIALTGILAPAHANDGNGNYYNERYTEVAPTINPHDPAFRHSHPVKVYINLDSRKRGAKRIAFSGQTINKVRYGLPDYAILVDHPREADMVIRTRLQDYDLSFRVIDVDSKDKKYKKSRRYTGGRCGTHYKAYYTKVKEKGEAYANYNIRVRIDGQATYRDHVRIRSAENFSYGRDLRARTNCGVKPTNHYPSNGVAELFYKSGPDYKNHMAREIREEAARDLGREIARQIHRHSNDYYVGLANRLSHQNHNYSYNDDDYSYNRRSNRRVYQ
ncbi:hypothetical protein KFE96_03995 [Kordiimonas sp. SCSIO 12603]|uniref:hypothetical protein n=1 Tax=Kordiimonas sp. SCSIO 12603 TaxID=2829596 RepID=UPI0021085BBC|nr:hypothetical protein [Kordiimonas sp. SCSIO 12603]UTW59479.1 hypothetical protein KFE96_03995 [Kordiimonas sp. SCSIO 12603]